MEVNFSIHHASSTVRRYKVKSRPGLTEPPTEDETAPPSSSATEETILSAVQALVDLGQKQVVEAEL